MHRVITLLCFMIAAVNAFAQISGGLPPIRNVEPTRPPPRITSSAAGLPQSVFFEMNSFAITDEGKKAIFDAFVAAGKNGKVAITGFSANTRNLEFHEKLALNRAKAVREALVAAGMYEGFIEIRPSEFITGAVDARAAHRVDIVKAN